MGQIIQFKITLNDIKPNIWRRIQVPDTYSFWDLHCAIRDAMGWYDCHLHGFDITQIRKEGIERTHVQMPHPDWDNDSDLDESREMLYGWFPNRIKQCIYTYDFGDGWDHTVLFEKALQAEKGKKYPICIKGKNACPPEDCGGSGGYAHLKSVINNPKTEDDKDLRQWMGLGKGEIYDPTKWDVEMVKFRNPKTDLKNYLKEQG